MIINLGNRIVNNYLITGEGGHILIDTGYQSGFRRFQKKLKKAGIDPKDIKIIFLTHAHDDHAGFLNDVLAMTDANVVLHPKAIEGLRRGQNSFEGGCSSRLAYFFCLVLARIGDKEQTSCHGDHVQERQTFCPKGRYVRGFCDIFGFTRPQPQAFRILSKVDVFGKCC